MAEALGIFQSDLIIKTALEAAIQDLRANPWLLDYIFSSIKQDSITSKYYSAEIDNAKNWFLKTNIPVFMATRLHGPDLPCISISLQESVETESTLGDIHYQTAEPIKTVNPTLYGPFNPKSYNASTGVFVFPDAIVGNVDLFPNLVIIDNNGTSHTITEVIDLQTVVLTPGTSANFQGALLKQAQSNIITLESVEMREAYTLGLHVSGEAVYLSYLYSVVMFILFRYKQAYLEARGFGRSTVQAADENLNSFFENEVVFSRFITITGYVRQYWPKFIKPTISGTTGLIQVIGGDNTPEIQINNATWAGDKDSLE